MQRRSDMYLRHTKAESSKKSRKGPQRREIIQMVSEHLGKVGQSCRFKRESRSFLILLLKFDKRITKKCLILTLKSPMCTFETGLYWASIVSRQQFDFQPLIVA